MQINETGYKTITSDPYSLTLDQNVVQRMIFFAENQLKLAYRDDYEELLSPIINYLMLATNCTRLAGCQKICSA